jgi:hypothetical protein
VLSELAEPIGAPLADQRQVRERLDVLDERRPAADPVLERPRGAGRRDRLAVVDQVDEGALLSRQIARRHVDHADARRPRLGLVPLLERVRDGLSRVAGADLDAHDHLVRTHRGGRQERAIEHKMRTSTSAAHP